MIKSSYILTLAAVGAVTSFAPRQVSGQEAQSPPNAPQTTMARDSLPFRAGQWGAEFAIDDGTLGLGVLWFRSARRAWFLDAAVSAAWSEFESSIGEWTGNRAFVRGRAGPRTYRAVRAGIGAYVGIGLTGAYAWTRSGDDRMHTWDAGIFGELGAAYLVTSHLSLGARVEASALFAESHRRADSSGWRDREVNVGVRPIRVVGALYF